MSEKKFFFMSYAVIQGKSWDFGWQVIEEHPLLWAAKMWKEGHQYVVLAFYEVSAEVVELLKEVENG